jgi:succinyl-CoA synthetase beta subunit/citryl-CoA synthetase large subunit
MAKVLEHHAKALLKERGLPVPEGFVIRDPEDRRLDSPPVGPPWMLKALVPLGRKGKAGLVRKAANPAEARRIASELLGRQHGGFRIEQILVEEQVPIQREFYVAFLYDSIARAPLLMFSPQGGMDIEALSQLHPERIFRQVIDAGGGLHPFQARALCFKAGMRAELTARLAPVLTSLWRLFYDLDLRLLEINPLALLADGRLSLAGVLLNVDDDALFRHPDLSGIAEYGLDRSLSNLTARERRVVEADLAAPGSGAVRYTELDGDIALAVIGGGASLVVMDAIIRKGGRPANYSDIGPGKDSRAKMMALLEAALSKPGLKGFMTGSSVLAAADLSGMGPGLLQFMKDRGFDPRNTPVVVRLAGLGEERNRQALAGVPGIHFFGSEITIEEAAEKIVALVGSSASGGATA